MPNSADPMPVADMKTGDPVLSEAAKRALAEAEARRKAADAAAQAGPKEIGGQGGPDPIRYGDWEKGGIVSDF
jgi:hypothetical protein